MPKSECGGIKQVSRKFPPDCRLQSGAQRFSGPPVALLRKSGYKTGVGKGNHHLLTALTKFVCWITSKQREGKSREGHRLFKQEKGTGAIRGPKELCHSENFRKQTLKRPSARKRMQSH